MDDERFDRLTRSLTSRRGVLGGLLGSGLVVLWGWDEAKEAAAHNYVASCQRIKSAQRRRTCLRRARAHNRSHQRPRCVPQSAAATCAGRCGVWTNNCNQAVPCFLCPPGKTCLGNGSCAQICTDTCPAGCNCSTASVEGPAHCVPPSTPTTCDGLLCASTAECPVGQHCQAGCRGGPRCVPLCPN